MTLHVGTSGYDYDPWKGIFYPDKLPKKQRLTYYASRFNSLELNASFYRKPSLEAVQAWAAQVPADFRFAMKVWQRITHQKRLKECDELVSVFAATARGLGDKLGVLLYQLPPNLKKDAGLLRAFLALLPRDQRAAFEFRNASWLDDETWGLLGDAGAALCIADTEESSTPFVRTAPWGYFRLRREDYDPAMLAGWAERIRGAGFTSDVFVYFKHEDAAKGTRYATEFAAVTP